MQQFSKKTLRNFFFGTPASDEREQVSSWFTAEGENPEFENELYVLWNELPESIDRASSRKGFERFSASLAHKGIGGAAGPRKTIRRIGKWAVKVAACLAVPLAVFALYLNGQAQKPKNWIEKHVAYGEKMQVTLPDNSTVWLNAGSKIIYPEKFNRKVRQVFVTGEVYADIEKDPSRPFFLSVGNLNIKVLGTKFNVKSYPEQSKTEVSLIEGSISLEANFNGFTRQYTLEPGNYMSIDHRTGAVDTFQFSPASYTSWSEENGGLYFRNQTLEEITADLERKFNVKIILRDEQLKHERYFASFVNNESLDDILKFLKLGSSFQYVSNKNVIDIYKHRTQPKQAI